MINDGGDLGSPCTIGVKVLKPSSILALSPVFEVRKSYLKILQNDKEKMVRPWVKVSLRQYDKLRNFREKTGKPLSKIIREAVAKFTTKKDYPVSAAASHLPKGTRDKYKSFISLFSQI
jgi:predicted DNA-binding protein